MRVVNLLVLLVGMSSIWRQYPKLGKYHSTKMLGNLSKIIQEVLPVNDEDWMIKYMAHKEGRNVTQINDIASLMSKDCGEDIKVCFKALYHLIRDTYFGKLAELNIMKWLQGKGHKVVFADGKLDAQGVDLIVDDKILLQVKPDIFFKGNSNRGLLTDRIKLYNQSLHFDNYYVMIYKSRCYDTFDHTAYRVCNLIDKCGYNKGKEFNYEQQ